jgi:pyruvate dehydrogenase E1 component alpha subunit
LQTAGEIWRRAEGLGFPGVRVDGNDVLAVYKVTAEAAARARSGGGPTLIEALTYRLGPHTTADDASRYRDEDEVERWRAFDPIDRYRTWLLAAGHADEGYVRETEEAAAVWVSEVRAGVIATEPPPPEWMFDWTFAEPPAELLRQRVEALGG